MLRWIPLLIVAAAILIDSWIEDGSDAVQVERSHSVAASHEVSESPERVQTTRKCLPPAESRPKRSTASKPPAPARGAETEASLRHPAGVVEFLTRTHTQPS